MTEGTAYNGRLQPQSIEAAKSGSLWKLENFYCASQGTACTTNNGNVLSQRLSGGGLTLATTYVYDKLNRLKSAVENGATPVNRTYDYDRYGNMTAGGTGSSVPSGQECGTYDAVTNRCNGWGYDAAGNLNSMAYGTASWTMGYNAESMQTSLTETASGITATWQYSYDGEGRRVKKTNGSRTVVYVYDAMGQLTAEYDTMAQEADCGRCYLTADHLGSTRLVTDETGQVKKRYDYEPFGWEINTGFSGRAGVAGYANGDETNPKFTGKERDYETTLGLDYFGARYFSGAMGRFTSPDEFPGGPYEVGGAPSSKPGPLPYADITNPQSLNKYAYAFNNPLRYVDPDGHEPLDGQEVLEALRDSFVGYGKEAANTVIGLANTVNRPIDATLSTFTDFRFGQIKEFEATNKVQGNAMLGMAIIGMVGTGGESGGVKLVSAIGKDKGLARLAQEAGSSVQKGIDTLTSQLAKGNLNPGIGTKNLFGNISYARARDGARVFFRQAGNQIEILAKASKKNEAQVIKKLEELYK